MLPQYAATQLESAYCGDFPPRNAIPANTQRVSPFEGDKISPAHSVRCSNSSAGVAAL
ncbi:hypothetical protein KCP69_17465 [Salmonella enterica subsp. enterica]|nr:hypothetical protein KCP69_17465 [Salmonella enterica subsp. enterica]